ncbi:hypothetical protein D3C87_856580 [compost metagenome]
MLHKRIDGLTLEEQRAGYVIQYLPQGIRQLDNDNRVDSVHLEWSGGINLVGRDFQSFPNQLGQIGRAFFPENRIFCLSRRFAKVPLFQLIGFSVPCSLIP